MCSYIRGHAHPACSHAHNMHGLTRLVSNAHKCWSLGLLRHSVLYELFTGGCAVSQDLLPYLVRQQFRSQPFAATQLPGSQGALQSANSLASGSCLVDVISGAVKGKAVSKKRGLWCNAFVAGKDAYCGRADTLQAFGEVSRSAQQSSL